VYILYVQSNVLLTCLMVPILYAASDPYHHRNYNRHVNGLLAVNRQ